MNRLQPFIVVWRLKFFNGGIGNEQLESSLFSTTTKSSLSRQIDPRELMEVGSDAFLDDIFPEAPEFLGGEPGQYYIRSDYGGLMVYTTLEGPNGSVTSEHCF